MNQNHLIAQNAGPKGITHYVREGLIAGAVVSFTYPLEAMSVFYHTSDVNPYLLRTDLKLKTPKDMYSYFNKRDGSYKIFSCYWSGLLDCTCEIVRMYIKYYFTSEVFKFKSSAALDPVSGKPRKVSLKESVRVFLGTFLVDSLTAVLISPVDTLFIKLVSDYEPVPQFENIVDCFCKTVEKEGFAGLFRPLGYKILYTFFDCLIETLFFSMNYPSDIIQETQPNNTKKCDLRYYFLKYLKIAITYPLDRLFYRAAILADVPFEIGFGSYTGYWLESLTNTLELGTYLWNHHLKGEL